MVGAQSWRGVNLHQPRRLSFQSGFWRKRGVRLKGVGAVGDVGKALMARGDFNPQAIQRTIDGIRSDAGAVRSAYSVVRGAAGNPLERGR